MPTVIQRDDGFTPMPAVSHAILVHNRSRSDRLADGIVITPSHNPPEDGGFKYNPTNGGPADTDVTQWIEGRANELLRDRNAAVRRVASAAAIAAATTRQEDLVLPYVNDLRDVVRERKPRGGLGVDQFGVAVRGCAGDDPLQDLLNLGNDARINLPGRAEGNWRWRCTKTC